MKRKRDAETGEFLSDEEAEQRPRNTWVEEEVKPSLKTTLKVIFQELENQSTTPSGYTFSIIPISEIKTIFNSHGADIE